MVRLNIIMPDELVKELESVPSKSRFITQALREKLQREKKEKLESLMIEGYMKANREDKKLKQDWDKAALKDEFALPAKAFGLVKESKVKSQQIRTVDKSRLTKKLGTIGPLELADVEQSLLIHLGIEL